MKFETIEEANLAVQFLIQQRDSINNEYIKALVQATSLQSQISILQQELNTYKNKNNKSADAPVPTREV